MDLGPKKHTSQNEVLRSTPDILVFDPTSLSHKTRWSYNHHFDWYFGRVCMKSWFEIGLLDPAQHVTGIQQFSEIMTRSSTLSPSYELPPETNHSQLSTFPRPCLVCSWGKLKACNAVCSVQWFLACFCNNLVWGTFIYVFRCWADCVVTTCWVCLRDLKITLTDKTAGHKPISDSVSISSAE